MEEVECAECGHRYDSQTQTFCPRCGNMGSRSAGQVAPMRSDPRRRRVQIGGVILISTASLLLILFGAVFAMAGTLVQEQGAELLQDQPGGELTVVFTDGAPVANASVAVTLLNGSLAAAGATDDDGRFGPLDLDVAVVNVTITHMQRAWHRQAVVIDGDSLLLRVDAADATEATVGADALVGPVRGMLGFFIAISLFVLGGGIAAVRLRQRNIALSAGIVGLLPILIMAVAVPNIATMLLMFLLTLAVAFIFAGRGAFR